MELALAALALLLFGKRADQQAAPPQGKPKQLPVPADGGAAPGSDLAKQVGGAVATLGGLVVAKVAALAAGGGTVAAGGVAAAGGAAAGGAAAGGTAAGASGSSVAGGLATAAAVVNQTALYGSLGVIPITAVVVVFVINAQLQKLFEGAKAFQSYLGKCLPSPWALNSFEQRLFQHLLDTGKLKIKGEWRSVADERFWVNNQGLKTVTKWRRNYFVPTERTDWGVDLLGQDLLGASRGNGQIRIENFVRTVAFEYLGWKARYAGALLRNWDKRPGAQSWLTTFDRTQQCEAVTGTAGFGGLENVPGIFGRTEAPRSDPEDAGVPVAEQRAAPIPQELSEIPAWARELAQLSALVEVMYVVHRDPTVYFPWNPVQYAKDLYDRLELGGTGVILAGQQFFIPATMFPSIIPAGQVVIADIIRLKDKKMPAWFGNAAFGALEGGG